jgi:signal transduction histidine kinase
VATLHPPALEPASRAGGATVWERFFAPGAGWFLPAALVLLAASVAAFAAWRAQTETSFWVTHTYEVLARLESTLSRLTEAESTQRGFLLLGDEAEAARLAVLEPQVRADLDELQRLTVDNATQQLPLARLREVAGQRLHSLRAVMNWRREHPSATVPADVLRPGRAQMEEVRQLIDRVREEERRLLQERLDAASAAAWAGVAATAGTGLLALVLLLAMSTAASRHSRQLGGAYEALAQEAAKLEERVQARTAELADANATLQGYAHTIAHDLRAPLRNLQGFANALMEDEAERLSPEGVDYVRRLSANALRLDRMVVDLLAYSRLGQQRLPVRRTELVPLLRQVVDDLGPEIERSGATLDIEPSMPAVVAHPGTLAQALTNLLGNALKFVAPGEVPRVRVRTRKVGAQVAIDVSDEGIGIAPEHQERIFSVFERLHGPERYPGTGIGLAIVRKAVERMNGSVRVRSAEGAGTTFTIELPLASGPAS